jgi:2-polyprenyl-6-methoxyphenol hydroxylase-like FAD-dependent oxidoreductase
MQLTANSVLIVGGGFSGMSAAIQLARAGAAVDLVEIDAGWRSYGAGITLGGATLRALAQIGVVEEFMARGAATDGLDVLSNSGQFLTQVPTPRVAGPEIPGSGGIMRPVLADILAKATRAAGVNVRLGCSFESLHNTAHGAEVTLTDGSGGHYDLVVGADGLYSSVRGSIFPDAPQPAYTGQGAWRAVLPRPAELTHAKMWHGPKLKVGVNPVSKEEMYLFLTQDKPTPERIEADQAPQRLMQLLEAFAAPEVQALRAQISNSALVVYRPLESLLLPRPWYLDSVVLIGDAVHATTPHLAMGAGIGIEDAIVLAQALERASTLAEGLEKFQARRWERCRMVVENSGRLGEIEVEDGDMNEHTRIMQDTMRALAAPI